MQLFTLNSRIRTGVLLLGLFSLFSTGIAQSDLGQWTMYFGNLRINDRWAWHHEAQFRMRDVGVDLQQMLLRTGAQYHFKNGMHATAGYAYIVDYSGIDTVDNVTEHRVWQQWVMKNRIWRIHFGHRYRLEQRWIARGDAPRTYRNRVRYFLWADIPLNKPEMEPNTVFLSFYDEIFLEPDDWGFSQNRLFASVGYKFNPAVTVKAGYLYQYAGGNNNHRLQLGVWFRPDLRRRG